MSDSTPTAVIRDHIAIAALEPWPLTDQVMDGDPQASAKVLWKSADVHETIHKTSHLHSASSLPF
jgi:hypothetical protein